MLLLLQLVATGGLSGATDSLAVLKSARRAQDAYEFTRRWSLPERRGGWSGPCLVPIGRMCYWYDGRVDSAPPEPPRIRDARARLLVALDSAAATVPGDWWIAGQRVRYLLEDHQPRSASRAVEQCRATRWWCEALDGLVRHVSGDFAGADSTFAAALGDMPDDERCHWSDISSLLAGELAKRYHHLDCAGRAALAARWWWLAQPLWSLPGNDRRTEHFARVTMAEIEQGRRTVFGIGWADDLREGMVRYGWPTFWTREPQDQPLLSFEPRITGHEPSPAFDFAAQARALDHPERARSEDWTLDPPQAPERYAPAYARAFTNLDHQMAAFRRGDSCVVAAAYDLSRDTLFAGRQVAAALVLAVDEHTTGLVRDSGLVAGTRALAAHAPCGPMVVSLEAMSAASRHVARARYGLDPAPHTSADVAISDLLLFDPPETLPESLAAALPHALSSSRVVSDKKLGVYWELYGVDPARGAVAVSLTMTRYGTGWLRRAAQSLGLAGHNHDVRLQWEEVPETPLLTPRALAIDLAGLSPGRYLIEVSITPPAEETVTARRTVIIGRR